MIKNYVDIDTKLDKVNDECGVFGIYRNDDDIDVVAAANDALYSLQHRGQQSAGITVNKDGEFTTVKELGMVSEIFTPKALEKLPNGKIAVVMSVTLHRNHSTVHLTSRLLCDIFRVQSVLQATAQLQTSMK
mgnify:CR=1 FL=1